MKHLQNHARGMIHDFVNLLFPPLCLLCERALVRSETYLCTHCLSTLPHIHFHEQRSRLLYQKLAATLPLDEVLAYLLYQKSGSTQRLLRLLKYQHYPELGLLLGEHFGARLKAGNYQERFDLIIPVPLHRSKLRQRGYNQSELFARGIANALAIPLATDVLERTKASATQTSKSRLDRWLNVATIFRVTAPEQVKDKRILLVDDVVTTGATLEACAEVLFTEGCANLSVGAIAIA